MTIVTSTYRYKRPPRRKKVVPLTGPAVVTAPSPANDDRQPADRKKSAVVTTASRKQLKSRRAERASDDAREVSPEVKAFLARMIRPGGALPPGGEE